MTGLVDRDEARRLTNAATSGDWYANLGRGWTVVDSNFDQIAECSDYEDESAAADAAFIAAARQLVPALLGELDAATTALAEARTEMSECFKEASLAHREAVAAIVELHAKVKATRTDALREAADAIGDESEASWLRALALGGAAEQTEPQPVEHEHAWTNIGVCYGCDSYSRAEDKVLDRMPWKGNSHPVAGLTVDKEGQQ